MISVPPPLELRPVVLVGFMGSGKSTVGRVMAAGLGWEFVDTDEHVVMRDGRSIDRIFKESGEGFFREAEWEVVQSVVARPRRVIATGGGIFLGVAHRALLKSRAFTVWLDVPLEVARRRVPRDASRPLWAEEDPIAFRAFFEKRRAAYALADVSVEAGEPDPERTARRILERLARHVADRAKESLIPR